MRRSNSRWQYKKIVDDLVSSLSAVKLRSLYPPVRCEFFGYSAFGLGIGQAWHRQFICFIIITCILYTITLYVQLAPRYVGPDDHVVVRPQAADEGMASNMVGNCEYSEWVFADSR